jgi:WD40 repeat protein/tRNA A-37 threonylcarbamoyl transferase component Bud32
MDASGVLFSASFDGSLKKWNVVTGKIAYSFEYRNASVTALAVAQNHLFIGSRQGLVDRFAVDSGYSSFYYFFHTKAVSSITICGDFLYSSGLDGSVVKFSLIKDSEPVVIYRPTYFPIKSLLCYSDNLLAIENDLEIVSLGINGTIAGTKLLSASVPLACLEIDGSTLYAGAVSGTIFAWDIILVQPVFDLKGHTAKVNFLTAYQGMLYSASYDNTIIEWSLTTKAFVKQFKRLSSTALGHLGPVNSLSICNGVLFSASSDTTVRRWNILSAKHEDVYFGFYKPVTTVVCKNSSVFAGSEDFAVLMFKPSLPRENPTSSILSQTVTNSREKVLKRVFRPSSVGTEASSRQSVLIPVFSLGVFLVIALAGLFIRQKYKFWHTRNLIASKTDLETTATATDLNTIVNSIMGVSKHAEFLIEISSVAKMKKIASGGGGVIYTAKLMDQKFGRREEGYVIQKEIFARSKVHEEAFYQEVGIMIMLSTFPNFCKIIAYTENPLSMILQFYPDGSLSDWLNKNEYLMKTIVKIIKEITVALDVMHSHYLAHCDIKPQNVLIQMEGGVPSCYLTDFGITQILSEKIIATKSFHVINLRGLSIQYASPEALRNFRSKRYVNVDFKMYDVFSLACVTYEIITRREPWD